MWELCDAFLAMYLWVAMSYNCTPTAKSHFYGPTNAERVNLVCEEIKYRFVQNEPFGIGLSWQFERYNKNWNAYSLSKDRSKSPWSK